MVGGGWNGNLSKSNNWWQTLRSKELKKLWKFFIFWKFKATIKAAQILLRIKDFKKEINN